MTGATDLWMQVRLCVRCVGEDALGSVLSPWRLYCHRSTLRHGPASPALRIWRPPGDAVVGPGPRSGYHGFEPEPGEPHPGLTTCCLRAPWTGTFPYPKRAQMEWFPAARRINKIPPSMVTAVVAGISGSDVLNAAAGLVCAVRRRGPVAAGKRDRATGAVMDNDVPPAVPWPRSSRTRDHRVATRSVGYTRTMPPSIMMVWPVM
jgi:hypothetical protein